MKQICTLWLILFSLPVIAQTNISRTFNVADSSCATECKNKAALFKKNGDAARFRLDEEFFCHLSRYDKEKGASKLQIVNLGEEKIMSVTILEMLVNATNIKGQTGTLTADEPLELLKEVSFAQCRTLNLDLGKGSFHTVKLNDIEGIKLKISFEGQERIYTIGKDN